MTKGKTYSVPYSGFNNLLKFEGTYEKTHYGTVGLFSPVDVQTLGVSTDGLVRVLLMPAIMGLIVYETETYTKVKNEDLRQESV